MSHQYRYRVGLVSTYTPRSSLTRIAMQTCQRWFVGVYRARYTDYQLAIRDTKFLASRRGS